MTTISRADLHFYAGKSDGDNASAIPTDITPTFGLLAATKIRDEVFDVCVFIDAEHVIFPHINLSSLGRDRSTYEIEITHEAACLEFRQYSKRTEKCICEAKDYYEDSLQIMYGIPVEYQDYRVYKFDPTVMEATEYCWMGALTKEDTMKHCNWSVSPVNKWFILTDRVVTLKQ